MARESKGERVQFVVRGDPAIVSKLKTGAVSQGMTLSDFVMNILADAFDHTGAPRPGWSATPNLPAVAPPPPAIPDDAPQILVRGNLGALKMIRERALIAGLGVEQIFEGVAEPTGWKVRTIREDGTAAHHLTQHRVVIPVWKLRDLLALQEREDAKTQRPVNPTQPDHGPLRTEEELAEWREAGVGAKPARPNDGSRLKNGPNGRRPRG